MEDGRATIDNAMEHNIAGSMDLANVGNGIYVGNSNSCRCVGDSFKQVIHIKRERDGESCGRNGEMQIKWREEEGIIKLSVPIWEIVEYAKTDNDLLVHCMAGLTRSTAIALVCKIARGCDPWQAIADINRGQWRDRKEVACWNTTTLREILTWFRIPG